MTDVSALEVYAGTLSESAQRSKAASGLQHQIMHGDAQTDVLTESGPVPTLAKQARLYSEAIPDAVTELSAQMTDGKIHDSEAEGRNKVGDGQYFYVKPTNPLLFSRSLFKRLNADTSIHIVDDPSAGSVKEVRDRFGDDENVIFGVRDDAGYSGVEIKAKSFKTRELELSTDRLQMGNQVFQRTNRVALAVVDPFGFAGYVLPNEGAEGGSGVSPSGFSADDILRANLKGLASSAAVVREYNTEVARPIWHYNHFKEYGQSLSTGYEGWPALSKAPKLGNLMLGSSVRPASRTAGAFIPVGPVALTPLKAVVQDLAGATILSDEEVAALAPGAGNEGESTVVGMTNFAKKLHNQRLQVVNDDTKVFVASCCGVAGQPIEKLMKGDATNRWLRLTQAAEKVKSIALAEGKTYGIVGVAFLQGEFNYSANWGGVATKEEYKQKLSTLYADFESDVVSSIADQEQPPLFLTYQTGATYTSDVHNLAIGMAQWELSEERPNWVLATPVYQYQDKGGHLTANGYRWTSKQFAKVWHRVVELGQGWKPLSPLEANVKGREALIPFHVPHPPLAFDTPYVLDTATDYPAKGFSALDASGALGVAAVMIVADCVVRLVFSRDPVGPVFIRYADKAIHNGNGCLRDSDPTVSDDLYEYTAGSGQYPDENIPRLVGKPYPLHNWCIAFHIPAVGA